MSLAVACGGNKLTKRLAPHHCGIEGVNLNAVWHFNDDVIESVHRAKAHRLIFDAGKVGARVHIFGCEIKLIVGTGRELAGVRDPVPGDHDIAVASMQ